MNDQNQNISPVILHAFTDLTIVLENQGKSPKEIEEILMKILTDVEMGVVEELIKTLPEEKKKLLYELTEQNKSSEEISQALDLDNINTEEIEVKQLQEAIRKHVPNIEEKT